MSLSANISLPGFLGPIAGGTPSATPAGASKAPDSNTAAKGAAPATSAGKMASNSDMYFDLRVTLTNGLIQREMYLVQLPKAFVKDGNLAGLRTIITASTENKEIGLLPFCTKKSAIVPDTYMIKKYLATIGVPETEVNDSARSFDIYMKKENLKALPTEPTPVSLSQVVDARTLAELKQSFDDNAFKILTGTSAKSAPRLEERDWSMVSDNNGLCYGTVIVRKTVNLRVVTVGVERARYPVFRFKPRTFLSDMVASTSMKDIEMDLRIPEYIVDDQSYVSSYETSNSLQESMAQSSFTETDVAAAVSGSAFGCSLSASASYGESEKKAETSASDNKNKTVTVAYNFPRVTLILDADDLELTPESQRALLKVKNRQTLTAFLDRYGEFFSTRIQLGGRLHTSEEIDSSSTSKSSETIKAMKAAAAVAFSGWGANASVSASHNEQSQKSAAAAAAGSSMALTWQANGGDTLLCNDPKAWSPTVALHDYWRVTKRDRVVHLVDMLGKFHGFEGLPAKILEWTTDPPRAVPDIPRPYFTLRSADFISKYYMNITDPKEISIADAIKAVNPDYETTPSHKKKPCVVLGGTGSEPETATVTFILETAQESTVTQPCFQTLYYLKHVRKRLYVDMCTEATYPFVYANEMKGMRIRFVDAWRKELTGPIGDGASVKIQFFTNDTASLPGLNAGTVFSKGLGCLADGLLVDTLAMVLNTNQRSQKFVFDYTDPA